MGTLPGTSNAPEPKAASKAAPKAAHG